MNTPFSIIDYDVSERKDELIEELERMGFKPSPSQLFDKDHPNARFVLISAFSTYGVSPIPYAEGEKITVETFFKLQEVEKLKTDIQNLTSFIHDLQSGNATMG